MPRVERLKEARMFVRVPLKLKQEFTEALMKNGNKSMSIVLRECMEKYIEKNK